MKTCTTARTAYVNCFLCRHTVVIACSFFLNVEISVTIVSVLKSNTADLGYNPVFHNYPRTTASLIVQWDS